MTISYPNTTRSNIVAYTVSDIAQAVKQTVEAAFDQVQVRGEVSNYRGPHSSGHVYFALKDEKARLEAVIWRGTFGKLRFKPEEGMEVIATGKLTTFPGSSKYQIIIEQLEPAGVGALMALLEERRKKLAAEGLFDTARKRALPFFPRTIGVITSPTGAVIRDILHRLHDRCPTHVLLWPVRVQGDTSAQEVTQAIEGFNALENTNIPKPDVIIIARGGGSIEDLWGFNEETVVHAAAASKIPIISAIGHETDWTLLDHAADLRAPTPTGAAEMAVPLYHELEAAVINLNSRMSQAMLRHLDQQKSSLKNIFRALPSLDGLFALPRQRFDTTAHRLPYALRVNTAAHRNQLTRASSPIRPRLVFNKISQDNIRLSQHMNRFVHAFSTHTKQIRQNLFTTGQLLRTLSYQSVLKRGFVLVRDHQGKPIHHAASTKIGQTLLLEFVDSQVTTIVKDNPLVSHKTHIPPSAPKSDQGDLF